MVFCVRLGEFESSALACVARLIDQSSIYSQLFRCVGTILRFSNNIEHDTMLMLRGTYHSLKFSIVWIRLVCGSMLLASFLE
jgi:hypothetical protein